MRDPRWGRNLECAGEDPFGSGAYARSFVTGFQTAKEAPFPLQASACCKHFVANEYEGHREGMDVALSAQDLADSYLPPFQECVEEGKVSGIMCAYNSGAPVAPMLRPPRPLFPNPRPPPTLPTPARAVNGEPCCANSWLLKSLLRESWAFDGYISSDCDAEWDPAMRNRYPNNDDAVAAMYVEGVVYGCCLSFANRIPRPHPTPPASRRART